MIVEQVGLQEYEALELFREKTEKDKNLRALQDRLLDTKIAEAAQARWGRTVSWAASCGPVQISFTTASVPVMTRLRFDQRQVLQDLAVGRTEGQAKKESRVLDHRQRIAKLVGDAPGEQEHHPQGGSDQRLRR